VRELPTHNSPIHNRPIHNRPIHNVSQTPLQSVIDAADSANAAGPASSSLMWADRDKMTHITEARVITNQRAMGRSMPAATDRPYLTAGEVLRAGMRRAAGRKEMAAAKSTWDSEGGATDRRTIRRSAGAGPVVG